MSRGSLRATSDSCTNAFPGQKIVRIGGLRWSGRAADFLTLDGTVATFDPSAHTAGPSALLLREDFVRELAEPARYWRRMDRCVLEVSEVAGSGARISTASDLGCLIGCRRQDP